MQLGQIYFDAKCYEEAIATFHDLSAVDTAYRSSFGWRRTTLFWVILIRRKRH